MTQSESNHRASRDDGVKKSRCNDPDILLWGSSRTSLEKLSSTDARIDYSLGCLCLDMTALSCTARAPLEANCSSWHGGKYSAAYPETRCLPWISRLDCLYQTA
jgi:hypothetical protein